MRHAAFGAIVLLGLTASAGLVAVQDAGVEGPREQPAATRMRQVEQGLRVPTEGNGGRRWTLEERMKALDAPGLGVAVIHKSRVEWARGYGLRNAQTGDPVTPATRFQWASVTKPITATVVLRLVQDGVLDLDRDVNDYLKSWKVPDNRFTRDEKVTLRRLMSHTAGVTVSGFRGYAHNEPVPTILQVLDGAPPANSQPIRVDMTPGSAFRYSGGGYTIVQLLLEDVTGRRLADLARQYVFTPAGMTTASLGLPASETERAQLSGAHVQNGLAEPGYRFLPAGSGCCELWATPMDLARFVIAIQRSVRGETGGLLSKTLAATMLAPAPPSQMGLGFELSGGVNAFFSHSGGNPGFSTLIVGNVESGDGLAVACNALSHIIGEVRTAVATVYGWPNADRRRDTRRDVP